MHICFVFFFKIITAVSFVGVFFAGPVQRGDFGLDVYIFLLLWHQASNNIIYFVFY